MIPYARVAIQFIPKQSSPNSAVTTCLLNNSCARKCWYKKLQLNQDVLRMVPVLQYSLEGIWEEIELPPCPSLRQFHTCHGQPCLLHFVLLNRSIDILYMTILRENNTRRAARGGYRGTQWVWSYILLTNVEFGIRLCCWYRLFNLHGHLCCANFL